MFSDLNGKSALVTGGYGYLGRSMCLALSGQGAKVYCGGRSKEKFDAAFNGAQNIEFLELDVAKRDSVINALAEIKSLDILVNNAFYGAPNHPEQLSPEQWRTGIEGGLNQCYDLIHLTIPLLKKSAAGKIVNIASMYGVTVPNLEIYEGREELLNPANYGVAKAGLVHLTKYYAMYLAKYGITVNAISPGPFPSLQVQKDELFVERLKAKTKLNRIGEPHDLDGILVLLCSEKSSYLTGQNISVDGGWTL
ncbi:MAG: SDR family oxidoreductase [Crocinitomicaceae bacterium]|nr:SDR family oxidoreductase [Crocinitomicaceae bacterium]